MVQYFRTPSSGDPSPVHQHFPAIDITPLCCHFWWLKDWRHASLSFPYWRLYWNATSGAHVILDGTTYELDADHVLLIPPNTPFSTGLSHPQEAGSLHSDHLLGGPAAALPRNRGVSDPRLVYHFFVHFTAGLPYDEVTPRIFRYRTDQTVRQIISDILDEWDDEAENISHQRGFQLKGLIAYLLAKIPSACWPSVPADPRIRAAVRQIEDTIERPHPNEELAASAGMSTNAFARLFKQQTGRSPQRYLCSRRIQKACVLLHHTDQTIEAVAEECGFCNRHYFSRVFRREVRFSPAVYRRQRHPVPSVLP